MKYTCPQCGAMEEPRCCDEVMQEEGEKLVCKKCGNKIDPPACRICGIPMDKFEE